ncbi:hypothetical protein ACH5RR_034072 [Cinchona calisaya]|uniref:CoA carboxyltransferase N-terminal domain-containing protein n=1 Tax=Cinchona calisaya TaxID=153742 RepID=A0ABD2Y9U3_9GENT
MKGHYLNATVGGFTANTSLAHSCQDNGLLLHIHCAMHVVIDKKKNRGVHFRVLAKALCLSGGDHIHIGAVVNRIALEACVKTRNEGCNLDTEGNEIIHEASKWILELAVACEVWKEISSDRIKLSINPSTWDPMDEDMVSLDPIEFYSEEELNKDHIDSCQKTIGLTEVVQTSLGKLNSIPIAIVVLDFQFMGTSMGSIVGKKSPV